MFDLRFFVRVFCFVSYLTGRSVLRSDWHHHARGHHRRDIGGRDCRRDGRLRGRTKSGKTPRQTIEDRLN